MTAGAASATEVAGRLLQLIDFAERGRRRLLPRPRRQHHPARLRHPERPASQLRRATRAAYTATRCSRLHPNGLARGRRDRALMRSRAAGRDPRPLRRLLRHRRRRPRRQRRLRARSTAAYFLLDGLRLKCEAGYLARFLVEEFTQWAVGRKPRPQRVLLIVDEFSAIAQAGQGLVDVVERMRGFGVAADSLPAARRRNGQPGGGGPDHRLRADDPAARGWRRRSSSSRPAAPGASTFTTRQLEGDAFTGLGSTRVEHEYRVDPNDVRRLACRTVLRDRLRSRDETPDRPGTKHCEPARAAATCAGPRLTSESSSRPRRCQPLVSSSVPVGLDDLDHVARRPAPAHGRSPTSLIGMRPAGALRVGAPP